jgi:hypothetical protein
MKKLPSILLLLVYLASQFGALSWYICKPVAHIYFSWIQQHNKEDLISINIDLQQYNELKNEEHEIMIAGILYDVEEAALNGTTITLSLKKDGKETKWDNHYNTFSKLLHKHSAGKQATAGKTFNIFLPLFHSKEAGLTFPPGKYLSQKHCNLSTSYHPSPLIGLITPPPKNC